MYMIFYLEELACYKQYLRGEMHTYTAMEAHFAISTIAIYMLGTNVKPGPF